MKSTRRKLGVQVGAAVSIAVAVALTQTACSPKKTDSETAVSPEAVAKTIRPVRPFVVPEGATTQVRTFPAFVKGGATAKLSFRVPGRLETFDATVGKRYEEGEVVAELDKRDFLLAVERVEQALVEANAALKAMQTGARSEDVASLEASLAAATSQYEAAQKQFERIESLKSDGTASEMQFDAAKTVRDSALAAKTAAEKTLEKAKSGSRAEEIEATKAKIAGLEIDRQLARNKLADATLVAPFSGTVSEKFFDNHESVAPGIAILTLVDDSTFEGELNVSEEIVARQNDVEKIECSFEALPGKTFPATLKETSTSVQKGNRSYLATISVQATPDDGVLLGMVGVAKLTLRDDGETVRVPSSALIPGESGTSSENSAVWILGSDGTSIERRAVQVGAFDANGVEILDGLKPGETIVGAGARFLTDGQKVRLEETNRD